MATYLLDANVLIDLYDTDANIEQRLEALRKIEPLLQREDSRFVISPLIRYEALRGVAWGDNERLARLTEAIKQLGALDISQAVADLACDLYRFDAYDAKQNNQERNLEKRKFDMFHYATAKVNGIKPLSADVHLKKIDALHERMQKDVSAMTGQ